MSTTDILDLIKKVKAESPAGAFSQAGGESMVHSQQQSGAFLDPESLSEADKDVIGLFKRVKEGSVDTIPDVEIAKTPAETEAAAKQNLANRSEFTRGLLRGIDTTQAAFYGGLGMYSSAIGDTESAERRFKQYQEEMRQASENPATVDQFFSTDPQKGAFGSVGNFGTWVAGTAGNLLPSVAEAGAAGLAGAAAGGAIVPAPDPADVVTVPAGFLGGVFGRTAIKKAIAEAAQKYVEKGVAREAADRMATQAVNNVLAKRIGGMAAAQQITALQEGGGMYGEGREAGYDNPFSAIALGQVSGLSEVALGNMPLVVKKFLGKSPVGEAVNNADPKTAAGYIWDAVKNTGEEGVQEGFQEFLGSINEKINDPEKKLLTKENFMQWAEASAAGALAGAGFGGAGSAYSALQDRAERLKKLKEKGFISEEDAAEAGIEGNSRRERMANADAELEQIDQQIQAEMEQEAPDADIAAMVEDMLGETQPQVGAETAPPVAPPAQTPSLEDPFPAEQDVGGQTPEVQPAPDAFTEYANAWNEALAARLGKEPQPLQAKTIEDLRNTVNSQADDAINNGRLVVFVSDNPLLDELKVRAVREAVLAKGYEADVPRITSEGGTDFIGFDISSAVSQSPSQPVETSQQPAPSAEEPWEDIQGGNVTTPPSVDTAALPPVVPQSTVQPPQAPETIEPGDISKAINALGKGAVDGLYVKIWNDVQSGSLQKMDKPPLFEQLVLMGYNGGVVRSLEDVRSIQDGMTGDFEQDKQIGVANLNRLAQKYAGDQEVQIAPAPAVEVPTAGEPLEETTSSSADPWEEPVVDGNQQVQPPVAKAPKKGKKKPPATQPASPPQPGTTSTQTQIGVNDQGQAVFEDADGVRSIMEGSVRVTEPVTMRPTRDKGVIPVVDKDNRDRQFRTTEENPSESPVPPGIEKISDWRKAVDESIESDPTRASSIMRRVASRTSDDAEAQDILDRLKDGFADRSQVAWDIGSNPKLSESVRRKAAKWHKEYGMGGDLDAVIDKDLLSKPKPTELKEATQALEFNIGQGARPVPGMEGGNVNYTVTARKPDAIPDTFRVVIAGIPQGQGWLSVDGTGMTGEEAYERAMRKWELKIPGRKRDESRKAAIRKAIEEQGGFEANSSDDVDAIRNKLYDGADTPTGTEIRAVIEEMKIEAGRKAEAEASKPVEQPATEAKTDAFRALPAKSQAKFEELWNAGGAVITQALDQGNKAYRGEFEARTGVKLPKTVKGTNEAVAKWVSEGRKLAGDTAQSRDDRQQGLLDKLLMIEELDAVLENWAADDNRAKESYSIAELLDLAEQRLDDFDLDKSGGNELAEDLAGQNGAEAQKYASDQKRQIETWIKQAKKEVAKGETAKPAKNEQPAEQTKRSEGVEAALKALDAITATEKPKAEPSPKKGRKEPEKTKQGQYVLPLMPGMAAEIDRQDFVRRYRDRALNGLLGWSRDPEDAEGIQETIDTLAPMYGDLFNRIYAGEYETVDDALDYEAYQKIEDISDTLPVGQSLILDTLMDQITAAVANVPKKPAKKTPRKSEQTLKEAKSDMQIAHDAAAALMEKIRNKLMSGVDPEISAEVVRVAYLYTKAGVKTFRGYVEAIVENFGDAFAREFSQYMQDGWEALNIRGFVQDPAGNVEDYLKGAKDEQQLYAGADGANQEGVERGDTDERESAGAIASEELDGVQPEDGQASGATGDTGGLRDSDADSIQQGGGRSDVNVQDVDVGGATVLQGLAADGSGGGFTRPGDGAGIDLAPKSTRPNFHLTNPEIIIGRGLKDKFARNVKALELSQELEESGRAPTQEDLEIIASYIGWGAFGQELFQGNWNNPRIKKDWDSENEWLREHLGEEEWRSAQESIPNAHYTDPEVVSGIWSMIERMGFNGGRFLEPSFGIGNFAALMPRDMMSKTSFTAIELDKATARMAKILYPQINVQQKGYQDSKTPNDFYDVVATNVPFGNYKISDRMYRMPYSIHNYFFRKAIDQTKPGGLMVFVTSNMTMDGKEEAKLLRKQLSDRGDLVAAFRFPTGAFERYAKTKVVADLIIIRKRKPGEQPSPNNDDWIDVVEVDTPSGVKVSVNAYWTKNQGNILGTLDYGNGTTNGRPGMIVDKPSNLEELWQKAVESVPSGIINTDRAKNEGRERPNERKLRQNTVVHQNDELYIAKGEQLMPLKSYVSWYRANSKPETIKRIRDEMVALLNVRNSLEQVLEVQGRGDDASKQREALNKAYDAFRQKYGPISTSKSIGYLKESGDAIGNAVASLESMTQSGEYEKRPVFTRTTVRQAPRIGEKLDVVDAFALARNNSIDVDFDEVSKLASKPKGEVIEELQKSDLIYKTGEDTYDSADVFLSGNIARKIRNLEAAKNEGVQGLEKSIDAAKAVLPEPLVYSQIQVGLGAPWITAEDYSQFFADLLGEDVKNTQVMKAARGWKVNFSSSANNSPGVVTHGHSEVAFSRMVAAAMNNGRVSVFYKDAEGNSHKDETATLEANAKIDELKDKFKDWIWQTPDRIARLSQAYNEDFRSVVTPDWKKIKVPLLFEGLALQRGNDPFSLRKHQEAAVYRAIVSGKGLFAHEVGTGKTLTMASIAVESRRLRLANKPVLFAHNANSQAVYREAQEAYPGAKILYVDNLDSANKGQAMASIATEDWDLIIIPHSLVKNLKMRPETLEKLLQEQMDQLEAAALEAFAEDSSPFKGRMPTNLDDVGKEELSRLKQRTAKELVKERMRLRERITEAQKDAASESTIFIEDMGIDMLIVDEAHVFKKIPLATRQQVKGLNKEASNIGNSLMLLSDYIRGTQNGRGIYLFTGTPITNTLNEVYNMQRFIMPEEMQAIGVKEWDGWFNTFATSETSDELSSGGTYEEFERLTSFVNLPELRASIGQYMDTVFASQMEEFIPRPTRDGRVEEGEVVIGRPHKKVHNETLDMMPIQKRMSDDLKRRYSALKAATGKAKYEMMKTREYNPLIIEQEGVKMALDPRLMDGINPRSIDSRDPRLKINKVIVNAMDYYNQHPKATQMVFMEIGHSDWSERVIGRDNDGKPIKERVRVFNLAKEIKRRLMEEGVPEKEIAIFSAMSKEQRTEAAKAMNQGVVRFAIGGTETLGTGVNAQENLIAMHHLDAPWMPGSLEQRNGRGHRQGNRWNTVHEHRYLTEGPQDGRRWQVLLTKDRFIHRFMHNVGDERVIDMSDVDMDESGESDFESTFAAAVGDPRIQQRFKLEREISKLEQARERHRRTIQDTLWEARNQSTQDIPRLQGDIDELVRMQKAYRDSKPKADDSGRVPEPIMTLGDVAGFPSKDIKGAEAIGKALQDLFERYSMSSFATGDKKKKKVAEYRGVGIFILGKQMFIERQYYEIKPSFSSMDGLLRNLVKRIENKTAEIDKKQAFVKSANDSARLPFVRQEQLDVKKNKLKSLIAEIESNPEGSPSWFRNTAPIGTSIYVRKRKRGSGRQAIDDMQAEMFKEQMTGEPAQENVSYELEEHAVTGYRSDTHVLYEENGESVAIEAGKVLNEEGDRIYVDAKAANDEKNQDELSDNLRNLPDPLYQTAPDVNENMWSEALNLSTAAQYAGITNLRDFVAYSVKTIGRDRTLQASRFLRLAAEVAGMEGVQQAAAVSGITRDQVVTMAKRAFSEVMSEDQIETGVTIEDITAFGRNEIGFAPYDTPVPGQAMTQEDFDQPSGYKFNESDYRKSVVSWARDKWGEKIAPNGKPTWQNFVRWFDDSEVVDKDGKPLTVYHGGAEAIDNNIIRTPFFYMTANKSEAQNFYPTATLHEFYVKMSKPSYVDEHLDEFMDWRERADYEEQVMGDAEFADELRESTQRAIDLMEEFKSKGSDGIIMLGEVDENYKNYLAFYPEQIKSATANVGTFDPSNPSILRQDQVQTDTPAFKAWFGDSKVVGKDGKPLVVYHGSGMKFDEFKPEFFSRERNWSFSSDIDVARTYQPQEISAERLYEIYTGLSDYYKGRFKRELDGFIDNENGDVDKNAIEAWVAEANYDDPQLWAGDLARLIGIRASSMYNERPEGQMVSAYLRITNPIERWYNAEYEVVKEVVPKGKHDGYIHYNVMDTNIPRNARITSTVYQVLDSTQIKSATANVGTFDPNNPNILMQEVANPQQHSTQISAELEKELDAGEKVSLYRAMMLIDGKLYPPMSGKVADESGKARKRAPEPIGKWMRSQERPDLIPTSGENAGKFLLKKAEGGGSDAWVTYAPYFHSSPIPLNDQFSAAWLNDGIERPQIVTVEIEVPKSELTSGYQADKSPKKVGANTWRAGVVASKIPGGRKVVLSRYARIKRIVPDAEVAEKIAEIVNPARLSIPENVVTPQLLAELKKNNVRIAPAGTSGDDIFYQTQPKGKVVKGWTKFISAHRALIGATNKADFSTFIHEFFHPMRVFLLDRKIPAEKRVGITDQDIESLEKYCGVKDGDWEFKSIADDKQRRSAVVMAEEKAAKAWEQYWFEGNSPNKALESLFQKISRWMREVYSSIQEITGTPLPKEIRDLFDKLVQRGLPADQRGGKGGEPVRGEPVLRPANPITSVQNEVANKLALLRGSPGLVEPESETMQEWLDVAASRLREDPMLGDRLVKELIASGRTPDQIEVAILQIHYRALDNALTSAGDRLFEAKDRKDDAAAAKALKECDALMNQLEEMDIATKRVGTTQARAFLARKIVLYADFSPAALLRKARVANGGEKLNEDQKREIAELARQIAELEGNLLKEQQRVTDLERQLALRQTVDDEIKQTKPRKPDSKRQKAATAVQSFVQKFSSVFKPKDDKTDTLMQTEDELMADEAEGVVKAYVEAGVYSYGELLANLRKDVGGEIPVQAKAAFATAWQNLRAQGEIPVPELDPNDLNGLTKIAREIQKFLIEGGIVDEKDPNRASIVLDAVWESLREIDPDITERQTMDALSGYGQFTPLDPDEVKKLQRDINGQLLQLGKKLDLEAEIRPKATGAERREMSPEERQLLREVNELKRTSKLYTEDRQGLLKSSISAALRATRNRIIDLRKAMRDGKPIVKTQVDLASQDEDLAKERKLLAEVLKDYRDMFPRPGVTDAQRIAAAMRATDREIAILEEQIKTKNFSPKGRGNPVTSAELRAKQAELEAVRARRDAIRAQEDPDYENRRADIALIANLKARLADYEDRRAKGYFGAKPKKPPRKLSPEALEAKRALEDKKEEFFRLAAEYRLANLSPKERVFDWLRETSFLARAIMTSLDLSAVFRQGGPGTFSHPMLAKETTKEMRRAIFSQAEEFKIAENMRDHANYNFAVQAGLDITASSGKIQNQEEAYMGRWARDGIGKKGTKLNKFSQGLLKPVAMSARAYTTYLNGIRFRLFNYFVDTLGANGQVTLDEAKVIAKFINVSTGRSDLGSLNKVAASASTLLFAPRYLASRFQYLGMPFYMLQDTKTSGRVKKLIAMEYARHALGVAGFLTTAVALGSLLYDDEEEMPTVELDPRSTDFMKLKIGETRIDPLSGFGQVVTFMTQVSMGQKKSMDGEIVDVRGENKKWGEDSTFDIAAKFLRKKLAPIPAAVVNVYDGEDVVGNKATLATATAGLFIPLAAREVVETMTARGVPEGQAIAMLNLLGMSGGTYGPKTKYANANAEERKKILEADLKSLDWNSKDPAYKDFLSADEIEMVRKRREQRKQSMVYQAAERPIRKNYTSDESFNVAVKAKDKAIEALAKSGLSHEECRQLLIDYYKRNYGSAYQMKGGAYGMKESLVERIREIRKKLNAK